MHEIGQGTYPTPRTVHKGTSDNMVIPSSEEPARISQQFTFGNNGKKRRKFTNFLLQMEIGVGVPTLSL